MAVDTIIKSDPSRPSASDARPFSERGRDVQMPDDYSGYTSSACRSERPICPNRASRPRVRKTFPDPVDAPLLTQSKAPARTQFLSSNRLMHPLKAPLNQARAGVLSDVARITKSPSEKRRKMPARSLSSITKKPPGLKL
jgi:hypothetical protein